MCKKNDFIIFSISSLIFELKLVNISRFSQIFQFIGEERATISIQLLCVVLLPLFLTGFVIYSCEDSVYLSVIEEEF